MSVKTLDFQVRLGVTAQVSAKTSLGLGAFLLRTVSRDTTFALEGVLRVADGDLKIGDKAPERDRIPVRVPVNCREKAAQECRQRGQTMCLQLLRGLHCGGVMPEPRRTTDKVFLVLLPCSRRRRRSDVRVGVE
jgi:hypothetical protein